MRTVTQQRGFTLIELMIVVAILGILASIAAPSFNSSMEQRRLAAAVEAIYSDIRYARSESIKRSQDVWVDFTDGATWSYTIEMFDLTTADLTDTIEIKAVSNAQFSVATVVSDENSTPDVVISFDYIRGTANANKVTITVTTDNDSTGEVTVSPIGRIKSSY